MFRIGICNHPLKFTYLTVHNNYKEKLLIKLTLYNSHDPMLLYIVHCSRLIPFPNNHDGFSKNKFLHFGLQYGGPKVDNSIFCQLTETKQNKHFRKMHFSSFLLFW